MSKLRDAIETFLADMIREETKAVFLAIADHADAVEAELAELKAAQAKPEPEPKFKVGDPVTVKVEHQQPFDTKIARLKRGAFGTAYVVDPPNCKGRTVFHESWVTHRTVEPVKPEPDKDAIIAELREACEAFVSACDQLQEVFIRGNIKAAYDMAVKAVAKAKDGGGQ